MNSGVKLWKKAKTLIPGGNQLLSKRSEMFLPDQWPSYYSRAKGIEVWDLDHRHYYDMSIMGIGTCILGYANPAVDRAVTKAIRAGSMSTLNCYEEVALAEKLIELHPWAEMARFSRTGGEACSIAVRIGRAASSKDRVAFCGYHGWGDWYLSANLGDSKNLDGQLLPGLQPLGVPRALQNTALPFTYGKIETLEALIQKYPGEIGTIVMEVQRTKDIDLEFLKKVRGLARKIGAVLIYDEVTSGFRLRAGGMHMLYGLEPDIVILGKALGNGYPISAIVGKRAVMESAQSTFISSTYWTERIGFTAALETIRQYQKFHVDKHLKTVGSYLHGGLQRVVSSAQLKMNVVGLVSVPILAIQEANPLLVKSVFTQEMLKSGFLASNVTYLSYAHKQRSIDRYLDAAATVFSRIRTWIQQGKLQTQLKGPLCHSGFQRLN